MGIYDREYVNPRLGARGRRGFPGRRTGGPSVTLWLIIINTAIFLIDSFLFMGARVGFRDPYSGRLFPPIQFFGHFSTARAFFFEAQNGQTVLTLEVWRFISFQFLHADLVHLLFNMIGLWVFGRLVEDHLGRRRYLAFYLICGLFGALLYLILNMLGGVMGLRIPGVLNNDPFTPLIGASAGVFGVIVACAYLAPSMVVQLIFPPIRMKMKWFAYGYVAFALFVLVSGGNNAGGQAAHVGGAIAGFFFIRNHHLLRDFFDVFRNSNKPGVARRRGADGPRSKRDRELEAEVDRILDKQRTEGIQSLTERERRTLREATERLREV